MKTLSLQDAIELSFTETVVVLFGAEWCGPCKNLKKTIGLIELLDNPPVTFVYVDCDTLTEDELNGYEIAQVPQLGIFKNGKEIAERKVGGRDSKVELVWWIERAVIEG